MPQVTETRWLRNYNPTADIAPTFVLHSPAADPGREATEAVVALRTAFAFFRRNADRRYSAKSLLALMTYADRLDAVLENGGTIDFESFPIVAVAEVPFEYDEETEVKKGGVVAMAVQLPDRRVMLAVHQSRRRSRVGTAILQFMQNFCPGTPVVWVHQENVAGAQFCLANSYLPRTVNASGAVAYARDYITEEDSMAVVETEEWQLDDALAQQSRGRRRRPGAPRAVDMSGYAPAPPIRALRAQPRLDDDCGNPECAECRPRRTSTYEDIMDTRDYGDYDEEPDDVYTRPSIRPGASGDPELDRILAGEPNLTLRQLRDRGLDVALERI